MLPTHLVCVQKYRVFGSDKLGINLKIDFHYDDPQTTECASLTFFMWSRL